MLFYVAAGTGVHAGCQGPYVEEGLGEVRLRLRRVGGGEWKNEANLR